MPAQSQWLKIGRLALSAAAAALLFTTMPGKAAEPIKIGFGMSLTGPLAANGKMSLVAMQIWEDDINVKGGLLGRPVKLVYYDDQSNPSQVPGIYAKLLDIDKVDLIVSGYASTQIAAAMPLAIQKKKLFISLFGTGVNEKFDYPKYFSMIPNGPTPKPAFTRGFFKVAEVQKPKPQTIAIAAADAEFGRNACEGAEENAKASGFTIIYNKTYPPATTDFSPIVRAIQALNPDLLVICSYPLDTVGMVKAMSEVGFKPKMWGGAMVGLQATVFKTQLGPLLNGAVNFDTWLPVKSMEFPGRSSCSRNIRSAPRPPAQIRSATICLSGPMPICRCLAMPSPPPRASMTMCSPTISARRHSRPWWAMLSSASKANGRKSARWRLSFRISRATASTTSAT